MPLFPKLYKKSIVTFFLCQEHEPVREFLKGLDYLVNSKMSVLFVFLFT